MDTPHDVHEPPARARGGALGHRMQRVVRVDEDHGRVGFAGNSAHELGVGLIDLGADEQALPGVSPAEDLQIAPLQRIRLAAEIQQRREQLVGRVGVHAPHAVATRGRRVDADVAIQCDLAAVCLRIVADTGGELRQ